MKKHSICDKTYIISPRKSIGLTGSIMIFVPVGPCQKHHDLGRYLEALSLDEAAFEASKIIHGPDGRKTLVVQNNLADTLYYLRRYSEANRAL